MKELLFNLIFLWKIYDTRMRWKLFSILFFVLINAIGELFAIISIKPLLNRILSEPSLSNGQEAILFFNLDANNIIVVSVILIISLFTVLLLKVLNYWQISIFSAKSGTLISTKIFSQNLLSKYYNFKNHESGFIISTLTSQLSVTVSGLMNIFKFISSTFICSFILTGLLVNNFRLNLLVTTLFIIIYFSSFLLIKNKLYRNSFILKDKSQRIVKLIKDTIGGNKEIITGNQRFHFNNLYLNTDWPLRKAKAYNYLFKILPRSIIEFFAFALIIFLCILSSKYNNDSSKILTYVGSLAFAIQRLMPQMQNIFSSWSFISGEKDSINNVLKLVKRLDPKINIYQTYRNLKFKNIKLENIYFNYRDDGNHIFKNLNINIKSGDKVGIIGKSGSGKSTLIDLISGIIKPNKGSVKVNGKDIHSDHNEEYLYYWRNSISVINQKSYFLDNSVLENITFGENIKDVNLNKVYESAKKAKIYDYINSLPDKFLTKIGETGSKLSGGQAQRVGLARALYKQREILIMDEATSSLDERTELDIVESIKQHCSHMTLIIISHRKPILEICNNIINIEEK